MYFLLKFIIGLILAAAVVITALRALFPVPVMRNRKDTLSLPPSKHGPLADAIARQPPGTAGLTGILPLEDGEGAFAARIILTDLAVSSIDAQYYIWRRDLTGYLLFDALERAADRGVRVRLLLDDNGTNGLDGELAQLSAHRNIEVRLYNPFNLRRAKLLSYAFDFFRLNRRMHNKSFTVDGHTTIMGGRNIGDEYFGTGNNPHFVDIDVLALRGIVAEVAQDFDRYWAAPSVCAAGLIVGGASGADRIADGLSRYRDDPQLKDYKEVLEESAFVSDLINAALPLEWSKAILVNDDPVKGEGAVPREDLLASRLLKAVGTVRATFDGVSPYFVPGRAGVKAFTKLEKRGVKLRFLTNSLEATDVVAVHSGYTKRRKALLRGGVELYELRKQPGQPTGKGKVRRFGSSGASLHAKTFAVDAERIFVGSFNFDPRSTMLNTEMGLLIDSPELARRLQSVFENSFNGQAWQVELRGGKLVWIDPLTGDETDKEPGSTAVKRLALLVVGCLPVEWLL
ncbi:phospholipase D family protein [Pseudorhodobacter sp.]|uniref:phospholipase D family protein n=1 Tax=Pseudorhodobacter sp. TaxID=1934400 RepID=UPI002649679B|nr:phospholipase D family protein [Pseudorhodobacter sp.]MDN5786636.1 phospholipase D family protein [Pseudorhodobacter sp.]